MIHSCDGKAEFPAAHCISSIFTLF